MALTALVDTSVLKRLGRAEVREVVTPLTAQAFPAHRPDIDIRWTTITFRLSTHSAGGVTASNLRLAAEIDRLADASRVSAP